MKLSLQFLIIYLFAISCSSSGDEPTPTPQIESNISLITTMAEPGTLVLAQATVPLNIQENTLIGVGSQQVEAIPVQSDMVAFILPVLPAGQVIIDYTNVGIKKQLELTISNYTPITDPDAVTTAFTEELEEIALHFDAYVSDPVIQLDAGYAELLRHNRQLLVDEFAKLSAQDKIAVAYIMRGNMLNDADFAFTQPDPSLYARKKTSNPGNKLVEKSLELASYVALGFAGIHAGVDILMTPAPTGWSQVAGLAIIGAGFASYVKAMSCAGEAGDLYAVVAGFNDVSSQTISGRQYQEEQLLLPKDKSKLVSFQGDYRHLIQKDPNASATTIKSIFTSVAKIEKIYTELVNAVNKIKSLFSSSSPDVPAHVNPIRTTITTKVFPLDGNSISVKNISDPAITLKVENSEAGITLTASSTTLKEDKAFSFDVVYADERLAVNITKTISALYQVPQPHAITLVDGNNQTGEQSTQLAQPLRVKVTSIDGLALEGAEVEWLVKTGGGSLSAAKSTTDAQGIAQINWTLGDSGDQEVEAIVKKQDGTLISGAPLLFRATAFSVFGNWVGYGAYWIGFANDYPEIPNHFNNTSYWSVWYTTSSCPNTSALWIKNYTSLLFNLDPTTSTSLSESFIFSSRALDKNTCELLPAKDEVKNHSNSGTFTYDQATATIKFSIGTEYVLLNITRLTPTEMDVYVGARSENAHTVINVEMLRMPGNLMHFRKN